MVIKLPAQLTCQLLYCKKLPTTAAPTEKSVPTDVNYQLV